MTLGGQQVPVDEQDQPRVTPPTRDLDRATETTLRLLSDWRNFLVHNDKTSRDRLRTRLGEEPDPRLLTAGLAEHLISSIDQAFADLGSLLGVYGVPGLSSDQLWVAPDE